MIAAVLAETQDTGIKEGAMKGKKLKFPVRSSFDLSSTSSSFFPPIIIRITINFIDQVQCVYKEFDSSVLNHYAILNQNRKKKVIFWDIVSAEQQ